MTEHLAILTPTMNRSEFVLRALQYYASIDFRGQLVFGDASGPEERARLHEYIARFEKKLRITCHHLEHLPFPNDAFSIKELIDRTDAPYMAYAGDDDLLVPRTLQRCADFLDTHPDFSAAHGIYVTFKLPTAGAFGKMALGLFIGGAALRRLDGNGWIAESREVVGARAHVEFADVSRQLEGVGEEFGWSPRREFEAPLVEIHIRVQAAGLFEVGGFLARGLEAIERSGFFGEKTERVVV